MAKAKKKYKLKTYKAAAKRFRVTKNGKILRMKGGKSHLRRKKIQARLIPIAPECRGNRQGRKEAHQTSGSLFEEI